MIFHVLRITHHPSTEFILRLHLTGNAIPTITGLNPSSATPGGSAFTLTVNGTNYVGGSVMRWNGSDRTTTYVSSTRLTAAIPASDIATAGSASVTVFNPTSGLTSTAATFWIATPIYTHLPAILK